MLPHERSLLLFLLKHFLSGVAGALVLAGGLLAFDVARLRTLMVGDEVGMAALLLLLVELVITFGSAAIAIGVISLPEEQDRGRALDGRGRDRSNPRSPPVLRHFLRTWWNR